MTGLVCTHAKLLTSVFALNQIHRTIALDNSKNDGHKLMSSFVVDWIKLSSSEDHKPYLHVLKYKHCHPTWMTHEMAQQKQDNAPWSSHCLKFYFHCTKGFQTSDQKGFNPTHRWRHMWPRMATENPQNTGEDDALIKGPIALHRLCRAEIAAQLHNHIPQALKTTAQEIVPCLSAYHC